MSGVRFFLRSRTGNFTQMLALLIVPLLGALGLAIDYGDASRVRSELLNAADAAALGAISQQSPAMTQASQLPSDGPLSKGVEDARNLFNAYLIGKPEARLSSLDIDVRRKGLTLTSKVAFKATVPTTFMGIFGSSAISIQDQTTATVPMAPFADFYMLLDNTPSMGVGGTTADIDRMVASTPDKCAFACHDLSDANNYYNLAKKLGVQMRIDVVRKATQALTTTATQARAYPNQFRMGVYTFGDAATDRQLTQLIGQTTKLDNVASAANSIDLMTIPYQNYDNDQTTDFDTTFSDLGKKIGTPGDGSSSSKRMKFVFFVSDGVGDSYKPGSCTKPTTGGRCQEPIDLKVCEALKSRGIRVIVLYTTYLPLPTNYWYNEWISPFQSQIGTNMSQCATTGLYAEVGPDSDLTKAMQDLFKQALASLRLSS